MKIAKFAYFLVPFILIKHLTDGILSNTPIPILKLHALHKQYTDYPTLSSKYEIVSLYKKVLFIRNIQ